MRQLLLLSLLLYGLRASAQFSGAGNGTEKDPYLVSNADELFEVRNDLDAYYKQICDIDLIDWLSDNSIKNGWIPIGSVENPFNGLYDGNGYVISNLNINRENTSNVGLFGFSYTGVFKNISLLNPRIKGNEKVGGILGYALAWPGFTIENCNVFGGSIEGNAETGGIIGYIYGSLRSTTQQSCSVGKSFNSAAISCPTDCGGICGAIESSGMMFFYIQDNYSYCNLHGNNNVGGLIGHVISKQMEVAEYTTKRGYASPDINCERNYVLGTIKGQSESHGIIGKCETDYVSSIVVHSGSVIVSKNVCIADTIMGSTRIGSNVSTNDNYACYETKMITTTGKEFSVEDDNDNGISLSKSLLQKETTYNGLSWDFSSIWKVYDKKYPCHSNQTNTPIVTDFICGTENYIQGTSDSATGTIYVILNSNLISTPIVDGNWYIKLGKIEDNTPAYIFARNSGSYISYPMIQLSQEKKVEEESLQGDANGDGAVDAVDVVSIINYILGKPSSSFNNKNADANGDGQILVDDAVGTVNLIMSNQ